MASSYYESGSTSTGRYSGAMGFDRNNDYDDENYGDRRYGNRDSERGVAIDETGSLIASNKVEGTAVYDRDGDRMGSIYNFMVNKRSGRVEYAVLTFGGFLGMGGTYYPLPWDMLTYNTRLGGYMVDMDEDDLDDAPSYRGGQEPDYDDDRYGRYVYGYYGLPY
jgi:sporulation protein YlmC with PRC-barrel domain